MLNTLLDIYHTIPKLFSIILLVELVLVYLYKDYRFQSSRDWSGGAGLAIFYLLIGVILYGISAILYIFFSQYLIIQILHGIILLILLLDSSLILINSSSNSLELSYHVSMVLITLFIGIHMILVYFPKYNSSNLLGIFSIFSIIIVVGLSQKLILENYTLSIFKTLPASVSYRWLQLNFDTERCKRSQSTMDLAFESNNTELIKKLILNIEPTNQQSSKSKILDFIDYSYMYINIAEGNNNTEIIEYTQEIIKKYKHKDN